MIKKAFTFSQNNQKTDKFYVKLGAKQLNSLKEMNLMPRLPISLPLIYVCVLKIHMICVMDVESH